QRGGLARGVPAEQRDELPLADLDLDVLQDVDLPVVRVDPAELEQTHFVTAERVPRYASTTLGLVATASKEPSAILTPWSSATTRSEIPSTTCMSCSMTRIVWPPRVRSSPISSVISCVSTGFIPAAGSSSNRMRGSSAIARAISRRRRFA